MRFPDRSTKQTGAGQPGDARRQRLPLVGRLKLRHLELLRNLFQLRVLRKAAEASCMTQPAATRLVQEMEDMFGVPLFHRESRGMRPTPFGEALVRHAAVVLDDVERMQEELMLLADGAEGRIRIGTLPSLAPRLLELAIGRTIDTHPKLRFSVRHGPSKDLICALEQDDLDMCFVRAVDDFEKRGVTLRRIYDESYGVVCRPGYAHRLAQTHAGWRAHPAAEWVLPPAGSPLRDLIDALFIHEGLLQPVVKLECDSFERMAELARCADVLALLPMAAALEAARDHSLRIVDTGFARGLCRVSLACRQGVAHSAVISTFTANVEHSVRLLHASLTASTHA